MHHTVHHADLGPHVLLAHGIRGDRHVTVINTHPTARGHRRRVHLLCAMRALLVREQQARTAHLALL